MSDTTFTIPQRQMLRCLVQHGDHVYKCPRSAGKGKTASVVNSTTGDKYHPGTVANLQRRGMVKFSKPTTTGKVRITATAKGRRSYS